MKKMMFLFMAIAVLSCSSQNKGDENACQFVRELLVEQASNIQSVDIAKEDSVMTPYIYMYNEFKDDELVTAGFDIPKSWFMDKEYTDSLKQLPKYKSKWRKAYMIEVTMKSSRTLTYRVMMDDDGITPRLSQEDMIKETNRFLDMP